MHQLNNYSKARRTEPKMNSRTTVMIVCVLTAIVGVQSAKRKWIGNENPKIVREQNCQALILPESFESMISLDTKIVSELVLPLSGQIALEENKPLIFVEDSTTCEKIEKQSAKSVWDEESWTPKVSNQATPLKERIPCQWDDLELSSKNLGLEAAHLKVKSLKLDGKNLSNGEFAEFSQTLYGRLSLNGFTLQIDPQTTCGPSSCPCQNLDDSIFCYEITKHKILLDDDRCENAVFLAGFCRKICGASVDFPWNLEKSLRKFLESSDVDFYVQVLNTEQKRLILLDKEWSSHVLKIVEAIRKEFGGKVAVQSSGKWKMNWSLLQSSFWIMFLTLLMIFAFFTTVFAVYHFDVNFFRSSAEGPFIFARFDNVEDTLSLQRIREPGSAQHRAFDNPMFEENAEEKSISNSSSNSNIKSDEVEAVEDC